jgi:adenosylmethionine-8-amino-7-oxononanoate aminotransferase
MHMTARREYDSILFRDQRHHLLITHGNGVTLYDTEGRMYLDGCGGPFVVTIGHGVSEIADAMRAQAERVAYAHTLKFVTEPLLEVSRRVTALAPQGLSKVFWVGSGSEATEAALRIARAFHLARGHPSRWKVIGRWGSYHGMTLGSMAMGGRPEARRQFAPYLADFPHIPPSYCYRCPWGKSYPGCGIDCAEALERAIQHEGPENVSAFIAEPMLGSFMGVTVPPREYFPRIREICDRYGILLVVDEVVTGFGRTGKPFAISHWGTTPDLMTMGKGITSGYAPLAGVLVHERVSAAIARGPSPSLGGHTYAANPVACAAGVAVLDFIEKHHLFERVEPLGAYLFRRAAARLGDLPMVGDIRGKGLLMGVELVMDRATHTPFPVELGVSRRVAEHALAGGLYLQAGSGWADGVAGDYPCLAPPFVASEAEIDRMLAILAEAISAVHAELQASNPERAR